MTILNPQYSLPDIHFVGGESQKFLFHLKTQGGSDFNAEHCTAGFAIISYANKHGEPIITKDADITLGTDGVMNVVVVKLEPEDTMHLYGRYIYQLTITDSIDKVTDIPGQGIIDISRNIHKDFIKGVTTG